MNNHLKTKNSRTDKPILQLEIIIVIIVIITHSMGCGKMLPKA